MEIKDMEIKCKNDQIHLSSYRSMEIFWFETREHRKRELIKYTCLWILEVKVNKARMDSIQKWLFNNAKLANLQELIFRFHSYMDIDHTLMNYFVLHTIFDSVGFMVQGVYQYLSDSSSTILGIVSEALVWSYRSADDIRNMETIFHIWGHTQIFMIVTIRIHPFLP